MPFGTLRIAKPLYCIMNRPERIKIESEKIIQKLGLKPNINLPVIEDLDDLDFRTGEQIAKRILILAYLYGISFNASRKSIESKLKEFGLTNELSDSEKELLSITIL